MQKRLGYLPWEDYFLSVAFLSGMRSKDPCSQVGACIVNPDKIIVSIGYNGMPKGCSDDELPWAKQAEDKLNTKYMYVCHAEMNAVINKNSADVAGCTLYVVLFPCNECAKIIIQSRIKEVVYYSTKHKDKPESVASKMMLEMAGISVRQFSPKSLKIEIDFKSKDLDIRSSHEDKISSSLDALPNKDFAPISNDINKKRLNYIAWEEYFMALAFLSAQRSKDPTSQLGACVVDRENKIVGIGYNGMPRGCDDSALPWSTDGTDKMELKYMYVCHAEMNAILNKNCAKISGCKIYATLFPCNECAKFIIQEEIKEVIYFSDKHKDSPEIKAAKKMFTMTGVKYRLYEGNLTKVTVDFSAIDWNKTSQLPPTPGKQFASHLF